MALYRGLKENILVGKQWHINNLKNLRPVVRVFTASADVYNMCKYMAHQDMKLVIESARVPLTAHT